MFSTEFWEKFLLVYVAAFVLESLVDSLKELPLLLVLTVLLSQLDFVFEKWLLV